MLVLLMNLTTGVLHKLHFQHTEDWYTKWGESKNTSKDEIYLAARDCYYSVFFPSRQQREMFLLQFHPNDYKMIVLMIGWIMTSARFSPFGSDDDSIICMKSLFYYPSSFSRFAEDVSNSGL